MSEEKHKGEIKEPSLRNAIIVCAALLLVTFFQWNLVDIFTVFLFPLLQGALYLVFIVFFIISTVTTIKHRKHLNFKSMLPIYLYVLTILIWIFIPMTNLWLDLNFQLHFAQREKVASLVEQGELKPNVSWNNITLHLPAEYRSTSLGGGDVLVEKDASSTQVLFFTFRGVLSSYSGFLYTSSNTVPTEFLGDQLINSIKYADHWYFISSAN
jgi:hypothetical protein